MLAPWLRGACDCLLARFGWAVFAALTLAWQDWRFFGVEMEFTAPALVFCPHVYLFPDFFAPKVTVTVHGRIPSPLSSQKPLLCPVAFVFGFTFTPDVFFENSWVGFFIVLKTPSWVILSLPSKTLVNPWFLSGKWLSFVNDLRICCERSSYIRATFA